MIGRWSGKLEGGVTHGPFAAKVPLRIVEIGIGGWRKMFVMLGGFVWVLGGRSV